MAVVVQCYHCSNILELDDGFRGGVCRCSQCGSLLQVPKGSSKDVPKARPAAPGQNVTDLRPQRPNSPTDDPGRSRAPSTQRPNAPEAPPGSGAFARSPLQRSATATKSPRTLGPHANAKPPKRNTMLILAGVLIAAVFLAGAIVVIVLIFTSNSTTPTPTPTPTPSANNSTPTPTPEPTPTPAPTNDTPAVAPDTSGPNFLGIPLVGKRIVLSIDCGNSAQDSLSYVLSAATDALSQLQPDQQLIIAFWGDDHITTLPENSTWATRSNLAQIKEKLDDVFAKGSSDPLVSIKQSLALDGDQTIIVTAKFGLTSDLSAPILGVRKTSQRIDAIKIDNIDPDSPLAELAKQTNGTFLQQTVAQIESLTEKK